MDERARGSGGCGCTVGCVIVGTVGGTAVLRGWRREGKERSFLGRRGWGLGAVFCALSEGFVTRSDVM